LVIVGRTGAVSVASLNDAIARARAYEAAGVDALFFTGIKAKTELEAISGATQLPLILGGAPEAMSDLAYLREQRVRIALQGHAPISAATKAVHDTLKALRKGLPPKALTGLASADLTAQVTRETAVGMRSAEFLGAKR
jgi:carboxyvinyl-carboxyphosphonate phosphorylmutase